MEDIGDDFGDLYADVEIQASSVMNGLPNFSQSYIEQDVIDTKGSDSGSKKLDSFGNELIQSGKDDVTKKILSVEANGEEEVIVDDGSDSEDDLNIVLNDDDNGPAFPITSGVNLRSGGFDGEEEKGDDFAVVGEGNGSGEIRKWVDQSELGDGLDHRSNGLGGSERGNGVKGGYHSQYLQYKYIRPPTAAFPSNSKANGFMGLASFSSALVRGDREDNGSNQHMGSSSVIFQSGYNFSLPRYRNILDVNIDTFEQKPWKHPGADITDFFNFGFNEESWKDYCNCLQVRQQTSMRTRNLVYDPSKFNEVYKVGSEHETVAQEAVAEKVARIRQGRTVSPSAKTAYREMKQLEMECINQMPRGRAIQVEDSIAERQPSFHRRRPIDLDSDVVIQITVQDSVEDSSGSSKEELDHTNNSVHEASENGDLLVDDNRDIHCFGSASGDELPRESLEGNVERVDTAVPRWCSQPKTASNPMSMDSDDHESGHISNVDRHHHHKVTICTSEGDVEAMETSNNTREEVGREMCNTAPSIMEIESSLAEQSQCYPSSSSSGSHCEAFSDGACIDPEKNCDDLRRPSPNSVSELQKSVTSDHYYPKDSKRHGVRTKHGDCKYYSRGRSPISEDLKHYSRRLHSVPELKNHSVDDNDASPMSNTQGLYDVDHSTDGRNCQKERLHCFDSYDGEHFSYYRESELSFNYYGEKFSDNQVRTIYKNPYRKGRKRFGDETDRYLNRKWDEGEYFLQQRIPRVDEVTDRDLYHYKGGHTIDDMGPLTSKESRRLASKHSSYLENERGIGWGRKEGELQFRKRMENDEYMVVRKFTDDFVQEKFRRSDLYNDTERDYLAKYDRHLPCTREVKSSGRNERKRDGSSIDLDNLWSRDDEDEYWRCTNHQYLSSRSYREPHTANGGRWHDTTSLRNDVYDLRKTRRHEGHRKQIWTERCRDSDWLCRYSDAFDTEESINYPDDQVHFERRRHWHSEVLHWTQNGYTSRHRDDEFHAGEASFSFERNSRHKMCDAKHGSDHVGKLIDDRQVERRRYKIQREGNSGVCIKRSSNITHRSNYEKPLPRCGDSVDLHLVVGEGKSSGRCSTAGSLMCNGRHENMDWKIDKEQMTSKDFNESHMGKKGQADDAEVEFGQNDEKWHDKFPVTQHNEAVDIEEGQIITEELNESFMEKECASENVAQINGVEEITLHNENAPDGNKVVGEYDNHRILEVLAKMEKRRERFKEPITMKKEMDMIHKPLVDPVVETAETKQQRPVRKRRWGGS